MDWGKIMIGINVGDRVHSGGNLYLIRFENGTYYVIEYDGDIETNLFSGHYEDCVNYIQNIVIENADCDMNL
jgi:hypothetical protein